MMNKITSESVMIYFDQCKIDMAGVKQRGHFMSKSQWLMQDILSFRCGIMDQ
jgi:hypothetical protein